MLVPRHQRDAEYTRELAAILDLDRHSPSWRQRYEFATQAFINGTIDHVLYGDRVDAGRKFVTAFLADPLDTPLDHDGTPADWWRDLLMHLATSADGSEEETGPATSLAAAQRAMKRRVEAARKILADMDDRSRSWAERVRHGAIRDLLLIAHDAPQVDPALVNTFVAKGLETMAQAGIASIAGRFDCDAAAQTALTHFRSCIGMDGNTLRQAIRKAKARALQVFPIFEKNNNATE